MTFILALQAFAILIATWCCWAIYTRFLASSSLDNIPGPPATSFLKGILDQVFGPDGWNFHREITERYGGIIKIKALLGANQLYVFDPKALYQILVKDQFIFEETNAFIEGNRLAFGHSLIGTLGDHHRKQRKMLNPVFSTPNLRGMVPVFYSVIYRTRDALVNKVKDGKQEIDLFHWLSRTSLELIGQCGLGYTFDQLTETSVPHPYSAASKQLGPAVFRLIFFRQYVMPIVVKIGTPHMRRAIMDFLPWKALHKIRDVVYVMHNTAVEIFESKKIALAEGDEVVAQQIGRGKDLLSVLMRANMEASAGERLPEEELLAQISTFIIAGTDTTSSALSRVVHLLATHPEVQETLRQEIVDAKKSYGGDLPYDELTSLTYLDAICRETLRLYAPVQRVIRSTRQDVVLSLSKPIKGLNGEYTHALLVPKGTDIIVAISAANCSSEIWGTDSYEWKPERWLKPLPETVANAHIPGVYSSTLTFIGGGRACIGFKFSELEMKVVLAVLVESFKFSPSDRDIFWRMSGVVSPTIDHIRNRNSLLPIIVESTK